MRLPLSLLVLLLFAARLPAPSAAQALVDTTFTWQGYARPSTCQLLLYPTAANDDRTHTVVIREIAENDGPSTIDDAQHLAELISRQFGFDPAEAFWIFHWGHFSYAGATSERKKEIFIRATFRRTKSGNLSTPSWKVVSREEVEELADRRFE